jgi:hypothetical protein
LNAASKKKVYVFYRLLFYSQRSLLGTLVECQSAQQHLEKSGSVNEKQWSSAETELSDSDDDSNDENDVC